MRQQAPLAAFFLLAGLASTATAQTETTIHTFLGKADGSFPHGVTVASGTVYVPTAAPGTGRVFKFTPSAGGWIKTDIQHYTMTTGTDPGELVADETGALYGVTTHGGPGLCNNSRPVPKVIGCGTVYKLTPPTVKNPAAKWVRTVLYNFTNSGDGFFPVGKLLRDRSGALYGVTQPVPIAGPCAPTCGGVFQLSPPAIAGGTWTQRLLCTFQGGLSDGQEPNDSLVMDGNGVLYGTTRFGGPGGTGQIFSLTPPAAPGGNWTKAVVHNFGPIFASGSIGANPQAGVIMDASGALMGVAGKVYKLTPAPGGAWTPSVIQTSAGCNPQGGLLADSTGQLFGTAFDCGQSGNRAIVRLTPPATPGGTWTETVLHSFTDTAPNTGQPTTALVADNTGTIYGSTAGTFDMPVKFGTVFAITNSGFVP